jgi:hypothetical protein
MNRFINILIFYTIFGLFNNVKGQTNKLFAQHEIESINYYYTPLYSTDSMSLTHLLKFQYVNVYFFNGECSLCLNQMKIADIYFHGKSKKDFSTLFIVETSDTIMFNFHRDKIRILSPILWDVNHRIRNKNITQLNNTVFLINKKGNILFEGDIFTDKILMKRYTKVIEQL